MRRAVGLVVLALAAGGWTWSGLTSPDEDVDQGNDAFHAGKYDQAASPLPRRAGRGRGSPHPPRSGRGPVQAGRGEQGRQAEGRPVFAGRGRVRARGRGARREGQVGGLLQPGQRQLPAARLGRRDHGLPAVAQGQPEERSGALQPGDGAEAAQEAAAAEAAAERAGPGAAGAGGRGSSRSSRRAGRARGSRDSRGSSRSSNRGRARGSSRSSNRGRARGSSRSSNRGRARGSSRSSNRGRGSSSRSSNRGRVASRASRSSRRPRAARARAGTTSAAPARATPARATDCLRMKATTTTPAARKIRSSRPWRNGPRSCAAGSCARCNGATTRCISRRARTGSLW